MNQTPYNRTICLAAMYQVAMQVQRVANTGQADAAMIETAIRSLFSLDSESVAAVYDHPSNLEAGLKHILDPLSKPEDMEVSRYVIMLMILERKLARSPSLLDKLTAGIKEAEQQAEYFDLSHDNVLAKLADLYGQTISTLQPRIMVNGEPIHIDNPSNKNKIRTLLLAGIRAAVLWHQCGGSRFRLFWDRKRMIAETKKMLASSNVTRIH